MPTSLDNQLFRWMKLLGMPVSKTYLKDQLLSHPDYPSLLSITDTLDDLNIPNGAIVVEKEKLAEIPTPFLAHIESNGGYYELVRNVSTFRGRNSDLYKDWSGIIIAAEKSHTLISPENSMSLRREKRQKYLWLGLFVILAGISAFALMQSFVFGLGLLHASVLAGMGITALIVLQELGVNNDLMEAFCNFGKNSDCNTVIQSKGAMMFQRIGWSDIGIIYFVGQWFSLAAAGLANIETGILALLKLIAFASQPFIVFSVYYQWRIARKWCPLCLMVIAMLVVQCLSLGILQKEWLAGLQWRSGIAVLAAFSLSATLWMLVKLLLKDRARLYDELAAQLRFKKSPDIFMSFLRQQRKVEITPFSNELEMADSGSDVKVIIACGPYCTPCAKAHEVLDQLAEKYKDKISICIRFAIQSLNENDGRTKVVKYILQQAAFKTTGDRIFRVKKLLHDWFVKMDLGEFVQSYPSVGNVDVEEELREHYSWTLNSKITHTPTIFVNGFELPKPYLISDLKLLLPFISENISQHVTTPVNA